MKSLTYIIILPLVWSISACSTNPAKSEIKIKSNMAAIQKKYTVNVRADFLSDKTTKSCPTETVFRKENSWKALMDYANRCVSGQNWSSVEGIGEKLSEIEPESPWGAYYMSIASEMRGHTERAVWMIDLALQKSGDIGILRYQKGRLLWNKKYYKEAVAEIKKSSQLDPSLFGAHLFLGEVYLSEQNIEEAIKYFKLALDKNPNNYNSLFGLASAYIENEKGEEALMILRDAINKYPKDLRLRLQEAFVYENLKKDNNIALKKYQIIKDSLRNGKVNGNVSIDLTKKIKDLEEATNQSRQVAGGKESKG